MKINKEKFELFKAKACMTTETLSKKAGINKTSIAKIGKPDGDLRPITVGKLAKALEVDVTEILED